MGKEIRYKCQKCNFGWGTKTGEIPKRCPYCGKADDFSPATADSHFVDVEDLLK